MPKTPCMYLSALNCLKTIYILCYNLLKTIVKQHLRHQAVYSEPSHVITLCEGDFRGIKFFRCLVPITTPVNSSSSFSRTEYFTLDHSEWLCLHLNDWIMQKFWKFGGNSPLFLHLSKHSCINACPKLSEMRK